MLAAARDVWATFFLDKQLSLLREQHMRDVIENRPTHSDYWSDGERRILGELRSNFYSHQARLLVRPLEADQVTDDQDYAGRTQKLAEGAILSTHRTLTQIPFIGQPGYSEAE